jgi:hypothetical protein
VGGIDHEFGRFAAGHGFDEAEEVREDEEAEVVDQRWVVRVAATDHHSKAPDQCWN